MPCPECNHLFLEHDNYGCKHSSCQCSTKPSQPEDEPMPIPKPQTVQDLIDRELQKPENHIPGEAFLLVVSNSKWSGSIIDSSQASATRQGYENENIPVVWMPGGIYSVSLQKKSRGGYLGIAMILSGEILAVTATNAEFGVVSVAGKFPSVSTNMQTEKSTPGPEDSLSILKRRFATGEISEEDYTRMRKLLES